MSAAPATLRTAIHALFNNVHNELLDEVFPTNPQTLLDDIIAKAKADADGALVLFQLGDYYAAFDDDAEAVARVIGVQLQTTLPNVFKRAAIAGGAHRRQILLTASSLARNLRLLRMDGAEDIWIYRQDEALEPADNIGTLNGTLDDDCAGVLNRN